MCPTTCLPSPGVFSIVISPLQPRQPDSLASSPTFWGYCVYKPDNAVYRRYLETCFWAAVGMWAPGSRRARAEMTCRNVSRGLLSCRLQYLSQPYPGT